MARGKKFNLGQIYYLLNHGNFANTKDFRKEFTTKDLIETPEDLVEIPEDLKEILPTLLTHCNTIGM
jgi:hypothetical protein